MVIALGLSSAMPGCSQGGNGKAAEVSAPLVAAQDIALVDRLTWGVSASELSRFQKLGRKGWIDSQLREPASLAMPPPLQAQFDAMPIARTPVGELVVEAERLRRLSVANRKDPVEAKPSLDDFRRLIRGGMEQSWTRSILRNLYSPDQLREQMTWFWFNHFNVRIASAPLGVLVNDYEERTIRPLAFGRFCDLVGATLRHPAMLLYLGNSASTASKINENYARELLELHTMGVGSGYTQADVQALARVLTGARVDLTSWPPSPTPRGGVRDGVFFFDPALHDKGAKTLLGHRIKASGYAEIAEATELLCHQPATARRISEKIARYLVADVPPPALVDRMAETFTKTDGNIGAVLRTMIESPEFTASLGSLFKDPQHYMLSIIRLGFDDRLVTQPLAVSSMINGLGESLFGRLTPDGYPLDAAAWSSSGQLADRFGMAAYLGGRGGRRLFVAASDRASMLSTQIDPPDLKGILVRTGIGATISDGTRSTLESARNAPEWNALFLASPEFMRR
jgi:uncharacterized protein (DUF1800 family)